MPDKLDTEQRRVFVREMAAQGISDIEIARSLGVHPRTILRDRQALDIPPGVPPGTPRGTTAPHGTPTRYNRGCHCPPCTRANADACNAYLHRIGRYDRYRVRCTLCGRSHLVDDRENWTCPTTEGNTP